jgi:hypothetical protein
MPEQANPLLLNRQLAADLIAKNFSAQGDLLTQMVNYASNLIPRAYLSSEQKLTPEVAERLVYLTLDDPPVETTHWNADAWTRLAGVIASSAQRIWRSPGLQPHRMGEFKIFNDLRVAATVRGIVGVSVDPLAHTIVFTVG